MKAEVLLPVDVSSGPCKGFGFEEFERGAEASNPDVVISYDAGILSLIIYDVFEQCAPWFEIECDTSEPDTLRFNVYDKSEVMADCVCLFDVEGHFEGIAPSDYKVSVSAPGKSTINAYVQIHEGMRIELPETTSMSVIRQDNSLLALTENDLLTVTADEEALFSIIDISGNVVVRMKLIGQSEISLSSLPEGLYLLSVVTPEKRATLKYSR